MRVFFAMIVNPAGRRPRSICLCRCSQPNPIHHIRTERPRRSLAAQGFLQPLALGVEVDEPEVEALALVADLVHQRGVGHELLVGDLGGHRHAWGFVYMCK